MKFILAVVFTFVALSASANSRKIINCKFEREPVKYSVTVTFKSPYSASTLIDAEGEGWSARMPSPLTTITNDEEFRYAGFRAFNKETLVILLPHAMFEDSDLSAQVEMVSSDYGPEMITCSNTF